MTLIQSFATRIREWRRTATILAAIGALAVTPLRADEPAAPRAASGRPAMRSNTDPHPPDVGPYSYDGAGNIIQDGTDRYLYDNMGRLIHGTANTPAHDNAQQFEYDGFGNLLTVTTTNAPTLHIGIDPATNHLVNTAMQSDGTFIWAGEYDDAGNQKKLSGDASHYDYDPLSMMVRLTPQLGTPKLYLYDANDERIATVDYASATTSTWRYTLRDLGGKVLRTLDENVSPSATTWNWTRDYVFRDGSMLAAYAPDGSTDETVTHYHLDHLGSPVRLTNAAHQQIALHKYWAYGGDAPGSTTDGEVLKFTGHERDADGTVSALDYMHARYYGALTGRFMSVDPAMDVKNALSAPQMWNRYAYALGNPMSFTDPTGTTVYLVTYATGNRHGDDEFKRAAETQADEIKHQKGYDPKKDTVLLKGVRTKGDFVAAIGEANGLESQYGKVGNVSLFSHSGPWDGPVFHTAAGFMDQLTSSEVASLDVNWAENGSASFFGCRTAWYFAGMFTRKQGVATDGFEGFASFSSNRDHYEIIKPTGPVYMMSVAPRMLREMGVTVPLPMTHFQPWPWDGP